MKHAHYSVLSTECQHYLFIAKKKIIENVHLGRKTPLQMHLRKPIQPGQVSIFLQII